MKSLPPWLPYVLPMALFLVLSQFEGGSLAMGLYPVLYCVKIALVAVVLTVFLRSGIFPELRPSLRFLPFAVLLGIVLCAAWVAIDLHTPHFQFLGGRADYDPWREISNPIYRDAFIAVRFFGLVAVAPMSEELFFRSFLLRFAIDPGDFKHVPIGKFEIVSCLFAVAVMAAGHPEWLAAAVFSLVMNLLIYRTKDLFTCVATHAATNLALGLYVIYAHAWRYW